ncbi:hypothetical protein Dda_6046 [Drechslerella dactyloides]|uniref:BRCT domain-containing protein n=1 Tax=Drechslerella dactyloides TaxID=74499 RepID=A0AAD6NJK4_DREDA|nr:hypothetical protein Dda_6046 [Drechslerella dactyloides]
MGFCRSAFFCASVRRSLPWFSPATGGRYCPMGRASGAISTLSLSLSSFGRATVSYVGGFDGGGAGLGVALGGDGADEASRRPAAAAANWRCSGLTKPKLRGFRSIMMFPRGVLEKRRAVKNATGPQNNCRGRRIAIFCHHLQLRHQATHSIARKYEEAHKPLFHDVNFTLIRGPNFTGKDYDEIRQQLLDHGAVEVELEPAPNPHAIPAINLTDTTHIISPDIEFTEFSDLERRRLAGEIDQRMLTVVKPAWVTDSIAKKKTQHVRAYNADPRMIFSGIEAVIADLPEGDAEAICGGILAMGGLHRASLSRMTTHIVALSLDNEVCKVALEKGLSVKMVMPHWFDDCLRLNRRIDEAPYLLPDPAIMTMKAKDPLPYPAVDLTYTHDHPDKTEPDPKSMRNKTDIFMNKCFYFSADLGIQDKLQRILKDIVAQGGGKVARELVDASVLVCPFRDGEDYLYASRKGIDVGNLTWLYWMATREEWVSPTKFLLHYPKAKIPIPGMDKMLISVSNYNGDARMYLENLIEAAGATFTRAMKPENSHLITARDYSDKVDAAREWNLNIVNHMWLEESYAKWEAQTVSNPRYTTFPKRTNLMEIVGQTRIDLESISYVFFPDEEDGEEEEESVEQEEEGEEEQLEDGDEDEDVKMADIDDAPPDSGQEEEVKTEPKRRGRKKGSKNTPKLAIQPTTLAEMETPRPGRRIAALAMETPRNSILSSSPPLSAMSTGSRRAKENATKKLHDIMPDVLQFEKEKKRKGGVLHGRQRGGEGTPEAVVEKGAKKRSLPIEDLGDPMDEDEKPKKVKKKSMERPSVAVYLLLTAHQDWVDNPEREAEEKKLLRDIGIQCIENPDEHMTHVCAPRLVRTEKFICALARAPIIVNSAWVSKCLATRSIVDTSPYLLHDAEGEKRLHICLSQSLERATQNRGKLLDGLTVYVTTNVSGGWETFKKIVEANGGTGLLFKAVKRGAIAENKDAVTTKRLVLLSGGKEDKLTAGFRKMAKEAGWEPLVYRTDWVLDVAMTQKLVWADKYLVPK